MTLISSISPKFNRRKVAFVYPQREAIIAFALWAVSTLLAWLTYAGVFGSLPGVSLESPLGVLQQRVLLAALAAGLFALALFIRRQPLLSIGWARPKLVQGLQVGLLLVFLTLFLRGKIFILFGGLSGEQVTALILCLGLGLVEETVFRGYIQLRLMHWIGEQWGWLATSLLFVIWQLPRVVFMPGDKLLSLGIVVVQGVLMGWIMQKTGHVLASGLYRAVSEWVAFL